MVTHCHTHQSAGNSITQNLDVVGEILTTSDGSERGGERGRPFDQQMLYTCSHVCAPESTYSDAPGNSVCENPKLQRTESPPAAAQTRDHAPLTEEF